ncbi:hypothetical protein BDV25DRAFT_168864 [Aspergillus avenaceus]|uniref:Uncharacterized protein n=1 Tax=Aspergillus avenaceus TaxID=36643 RepID=A0A5N6TN60_ASPAV|nr:hypothetical protein BDV25DRAFT_168864 [Aspergillus avenaceus]
MQTSGDLVGCEVERLITAPYAPSLQDLYDLLQHTSSASLVSWASRKPCQTGALVDVLVDGLSRSGLALRLLSTFASVAVVRDSLLERYPALLDQFLQRATEEDGAEYIPVCTAILSSPLPAGLITPAGLAPFVRKLIGNLGDSPCAERILPVYQLMTGLQTSPTTLFGVQSETMTSLQLELTKTLRNLDDHMGNLLCLATFARIASPAKSVTIGESGQQDPLWLQNVKHFFGPKRGLKTLDLVVLRVILACSSSCKGLMADQAAESIRLAIEICTRVEKPQRETWIQANKSKIAKLCEKLRREDIDRDVQILGITFLVSLLPVSTIPSGLPEIALKWILSEDSDHVQSTLPSEFIPRIAEANVACSGQFAMHSIVDYVINSLTSRMLTESTSVGNVQIARSLVNGLEAAVSQGFATTPMTEAGLARCRSAFGELIENFPRRSNLLSCQSSNMCFASALEAENQLVHEFFSFYVQASLLSGPGQETHRSADIGNIKIFMAKAGKPVTPNDCAFTKTKPLDLRCSFSPLVIDKNDSSTRSDWRAGLTKTLMLNARMAQDSVMQKVQDICYDLEQRCDGIEAPLRVVEEEKYKISLEAENLKERNDDLESRLQQASCTVVELQRQISCLEEHAEDASARVDELTASLAGTRCELDDQRRSYQESTDQAQEIARTRELDLVASLADKEEQLEQLQEEALQLKEDNTQLQQAFGTVSKDRDVALERRACLEQRVSKLQECIDNDRALLARKEAEIERLLAAKEDVETRVETLQNRLNEEVSESDNIRCALRETEDSFKADIASLKKRFEQLLSERDTECFKQKEKIEVLQGSMQTAASAATNELQAKEKRIQYLEKKIQYLRDERAAKAREFSEAQEHISRLMNVMGWKPDIGNSGPSSKQPRPRSTLEPSQVASMQEQTQPEDEVAQSQVEEAPFESDMSHLDGRSLKRSRGATVSPAPSHHSTDRKPRHSVCRSSPRQRRERTVLGNADQNSQHGSQESGKSQPIRERQFQGSQGDNHLRDIDLDMDLEFSKDFIFTSASLSQENQSRSGTQG